VQIFRDVDISLNKNSAGTERFAYAADVKCRQLPEIGHCLNWALLKKKKQYWQCGAAG